MPPAESAVVSGSSRPLPRWLLLVAAALLVARVGTGIWEHSHPPLETSQTSQPGERVAWVEIDRAAAESRRTHKPILYEFSADWCGPCKAMSREVFADAAAADMIQRMFVPVRVLDRQREEGRNRDAVAQLMSTYQVSGFPTLIVAWPGVAHFETTSGYGGRPATEQWLASAGTTARMNPPPASADSILPPR